MNLPENTRRDFVRKAIYVAPAIMTLAAAPSFAKNGSGKKGGDDGEPEKPKKPKKLSDASPSAPLTGTRVA
jgi:hypothetical protein